MARERNAARGQGLGRFQKFDNNLSTSFQYFQKAADLGYPKPCVNLGYCYREGRDANQDIPLALVKYRNAGDLGCLAGKYWAGYLCLSAECLLKDRKRGIQLLEEAAQQDHEESQRLLIEIYSTSQDEAELPRG